MYKEIEFIKGYYEESHTAIPCPTRLGHDDIIRVNVESFILLVLKGFNINYADAALMLAKDNTINVSIKV